MRGHLRLCCVALAGLLAGCGGGGTRSNDGHATAASNLHHGRHEATASPARKRTLGLTRRLPRAYREACDEQAVEAPVGARACPPLIPSGPLKVLYRGRSLGRDSPAGGFSADLASRSIGRLGRKRIATNGGHWRYDVVWAPRVRQLAVERGIVRPSNALRRSECRQTRIARERTRTCMVVPYREGGGVNGGHIVYIWEHRGTTFTISVHGYANEARARAMMAAVIAMADG